MEPISDSGHAERNSAAAKPSLRMNFDITGARKGGSNERGEKGKR
jgi:hypothetical protein